MRHTAATLWLASGEAPEWIARQLGHTTTEMLFRVYSRYVPNLTRNDGSAMDRLLTKNFVGNQVQSIVVPSQATRTEGAKHSSHAEPCREEGKTTQVVSVKKDGSQLRSDSQPPPLGWADLARSWMSQTSTSEQEVANHADHALH
jgi:integrase